MVEINSSTKVTVKKKPAPGAAKAGAKTGLTAASQSGKKGGGPPVGGKRGSAPPLKPATLQNAAAVTKLRQAPEAERRQFVEDSFRKALGEAVLGGMAARTAPHKASLTTRDRSMAAADVAIAAKELGTVFVLKQCHVLADMTRILFPNGIQTVLGSSTETATATATAEEENNTETQASALSSTLKPSASAVSLTSLDAKSNDGADSLTATGTGTGGYMNTNSTIFSGVSDTERGRTTPPEAREGCLLLIRAFCELVGKHAEPYMVGAFLSAALFECGSSNGAIREAAEDAATAIVTLAHPYAFASILLPLLTRALSTTTEWRVKTNALERMQQCAAVTAPRQVQQRIPQLIPVLTNQVWDTKAQVSKAARAALLAVCETNTNADVKPAIPAVVNAICKPADTNKAVSALMGTTFIVPVDAPTLAILCPILARALKEKLAIHKRSACLVISNMSKLVETPQAVAPFGSLLVPELQRVANNVQFEEIRDEALKALANLTKALGDSYKAAAAAETDMATRTLNHENNNNGAAAQKEMEAEKARVEAEQEKIRKEREEQAKRDEELRLKEEEERKKFKEAMDAQRELDKVAAQEAQERRQAEEAERERQRLSTKGASGKCQGCGLKKCAKSCMFYKK